MKFLLVLLVLVLVLPFFSAAHYIVGAANNALDGGNANNLSVVLWNPSNGMNDNVTDIIGVNGNSGTANFYMVDCEMLNTPCNVGDVLDVKVFSYPFSQTVSVNVTGAGYDVAPNITLNSLPVATPVFPADFANLSSGAINFNCSFEDKDSNIENVSLYGNWSGSWQLNETKSVSGESGSVLFTKTLNGGVYKWGCFASDNLSAYSFSQNYTLIVFDLTKPTINYVSVNETYVCGTTGSVKVTCNTNDSNGISKVLIEAEDPEGAKTNYSAGFLSGNNYSSDVLINETGSWNFNCISFGYSNNFANLTYGPLEVYSGLPDLSVYPKISFSNNNPFEGESINVSSIIINSGCTDADNFLVGFYNGEPSLGNQVGANQTISVPGFSNDTAEVSWNALVGPTNFFVFADVNNSINETNETNNEFNSTFNVGSWQYFFGNVSGMKVLSDNSMDNLSLWNISSNITGDVFITGIESNIDWSSLFAIGRDKYGNVSNNDFSEIDSLLGMTNFNDSVSRVFTNNGTPLSIKNFTIGKQIIQDVPVVTSINNSNFVTGILWDSSNDTDGEYDTSDKENLVFVTELNNTGSYEIRAPVKLRDYYSTSNPDIYLYYNLE